MIPVWLKSGERAAPRCRSVQQYLSENVKLTCPKTSLGQNLKYLSIKVKQIQTWAAAKSGGAQHKGGPFIQEMKGLDNQLKSHHDLRYNTLRVRP